MAAEFISCYEASSQAIQLQNLVTALPFVDFISRPIRIYCDNSTAIFFSKNNKASKGGRALDIKYFALRDRVKNHEVSIEYIETGLMVADPLTKGLLASIYCSHVTNGSCKLSQYIMTSFMI